MAVNKYETHVAPKFFLIESWAKDGLSEEQIAENLGIAYSTFRKYKKDHEALSAVLKRGKEIVDYEVQNALLDKCLGYYVPEEAAFKVKRVYWDENGHRCEEEKVETVTVQKYIPPDTTAQLAWLNNRKNKDWRRNAGKEKLDEERFNHDKKIDEKKCW